MMLLREKIKILTILLCLFNLSSFLYYVNPREPLLPQIVILALLIIPTSIIITYFYKGRNWARILLMIGAVMDLLFGILPALSVSGLITKGIFVLNWFFSLYLLIFLNTAQARAFFKSENSVEGAAKPKIFVALKVFIVVLVILVIAGIVVGGVLFGIRSVANKKMERMDVWLEDVHTGKAFRITEGGLNRTPRFSPNGRKIVYSHSSDSSKDSGSSIQMYSMTEAKSNTLIEGGHLYSPSWSSDGQRILYVSKDGQQTDLWIYSLQDGSKTRVTEDSAVEQDPLWSPDGNWIVFIQEDEKKKEEVYLIPTTGGPKRQLTDTSNFLYKPEYPTWAPNSQEITYFSFTSLVVVDLKGKVVQEINLAGLNNFKGLMITRRNPDLILFSARPANGLSMRFNLYTVSRKRPSVVEIFKEGRDLFEFGYDLSPDGDNLVYAKPS